MRDHGGHLSPDDRLNGQSRDHLRSAAGPTGLQTKFDDGTDWRRSCPLSGGKADIGKPTKSVFEPPSSLRRRYLWP
jgi:hypothetical protein